MLAPDWLDELQLDPGSPVAMGTRLLRDEFLVVDDNRARDLALKRTLLADRPDEVFGAVESPEVATASAEVRALIEKATGERADTTLHPLDAAGRLVQEDLCVLVIRDGAPHLDAASLCFPSYWRLADKLGRPLVDVHAPVPLYAREIGARVDEFVRRLRPGRITWRRNWSIHDDDSYFLPDPTPQHDVVAPDGLYLRSERQTLRRLVTADAVLFTIRTQQVPLGVLAQRPDIARRMATAIRSWPPELGAYKGGHGALAAHDWLATL